MLRELRSDIARYRAAGDSWGEIACNPVMVPLLWYRFGRWIYKEGSPRPLRLFLKGLHLAGRIPIEAFMQMRLDPGAEIGEGLYMTHTGGVVLHHEVIIGRNCSLAHGVTIGTAGRGRKGAPCIGNDVYIGTGATIIGAIHVGDRAQIAANTLVNRDVPPGAIVMGVPGKIVKLSAGTLNRLSEPDFALPTSATAASEV